MTLNKGKKVSQRRNQEGIVLLVALIMTIMFVLIGAVFAQKSKVGTSITGSKVRQNIVFEAAEQSLRDSMIFIQSIQNGEPIPSDDGSQGRVIAANFDVANAQEEGISMVMDQTKSFVWKEGALEARVCPPGNPCPEGIDFMRHIDSSIWTDLAIRSDLATKTTSGVDGNNYVSNTTTDVFIQLLRKNGSDGSLGRSGDLSSQQSGGSYYLITVKASGYPPGVAPNASNSRENVILQAVFVQKT